MARSITEQTQSQLKACLQGERVATKLENLAAALLGRLLGVTIAVAKSGFQHGGDAGSAGRQGRRLRLECKKYSDTTALSDRELLGEIDHALSRDPSIEAWILVATRPVSEQLEEYLHQKAETIGVPVIILDWKSTGLPSLAALCAFAPDIVEDIFSSEAGRLARALQGESADAVERLRRDLQAWSLGFETLQTQSLSKLETIWSSPRDSNACLGQNAAGGAENHKVVRCSVNDALDTWWHGRAKEDAPAVVMGWDGVGKTWATLNWLVERRQELPIVLAIPSSAVAELSAPSDTAVRSFLADRLYELMGVRDRNHWLRRLDNLLKRPREEGLVLTLFFDGLNQETSVPWLNLLKVLQGEQFAGRIRVIASTRTHYFNTTLGSLHGLIIPAAVIPVEPYDMHPGGELDQMLAFEGLTRGDLHPDLLELARTPRLFRLVILLRERLIDERQVTIHRLLWEYGRDSFGTRAGRSFSEDEWREWLQEVASRHREGVRQFSLKTLGETASRADLSTREVEARLSDIIDGRFALRTPSGNLQLIPTVVSHALGAALLAELETTTPPKFDVFDARLTEWLDPIAGLDQKSEILRAAVSILVERGISSSPIAGVLVTAWLQTQNVTDTHRRELAGLAASLCDALLDVIEHSTSRTHSSARLWAVNALRSIQRTNSTALQTIVTRARQWLVVISREARSDRTAPELERSRSEYFIQRIGTDSSGLLRVLGLDLHLFDWDDGVLPSTIPSIVEGFPLAEAAMLFEAAAIAMAVRRNSDAGWEGLKWLCLLNEVDPTKTTETLRHLSAIVRERTPEAGVNPALPARAAALLLWLTGEEADEFDAIEIDPGFNRFLSYDDDYLPQPSRSFFPLERRHAEDVLNDSELPLIRRIQRTRDLWLDPSFLPTPAFAEEVRGFVRQVQVEKLDRHHSHTIEDFHFSELEPVLARCAPDILSDLIRRKLKSFGSCPPESRYWSAIHATDHLLLAGDTEAVAARSLRASASDAAINNEVYAATQLIILEIHRQSASKQAEAIIEAGLEHILVQLGEVLRPPTPDEADALISRFGNGAEAQQRDLLILLSHNGLAVSDSAWTWLAGVAFGVDANLHGLAFRTLATLDPERFGRELLARSWTWSAYADGWANHYGTGALIEATTAVPFDQIAPRLAPWRVLEAARRRGSDPSEIRLAASIFGRTLSAEQVERLDPGANLSVNIIEGVLGPLTVSVSPFESENDSDTLSALQEQMDIDKRMEAHNRAAEIAGRRIREARQSGASLYLCNVYMEDVEAVLIHAPDLFENWLEGSQNLTSDFKRRVHLAEVTYLTICEALLKNNPEKGVALWRSLAETLHTRIIGIAEIDEMIHIPFKAPDLPPTMELRREIVGLSRCHTDRELLDVAIAATIHGKDRWLSMVIENDKASPLAWRRKRGIVLEGFTSGNILPIHEAWPEGMIKTGHELLQRRSALCRYHDACAHHWWQVYLSSPEDEAYAAWVLFLRSVDRRAWIWISDDLRAANDSTPLFELKTKHFELNRYKMKGAMEKNEEKMCREKLEKQFLGRRIVNGIGPWNTDLG